MNDRVHSCSAPVVHPISKRMKRPMLPILCNVMKLIVALILASCALAQQKEQPKKYSNCDFGYMLSIPTDLTLHRSEYYNHGVELGLPDGVSTIEVFNSYNMSESTSPEVAINYELRNRIEGRAKWQVVRQTNLRLYQLASKRLRADYIKDQVPWTSEIVILYRAPQADGLGNIIYALELSAPASCFDAAIPYFDEVLKGFSLSALPKGPCVNQ